MIKMPISYEDFDGNKVEEDIYFHISKAELIEWLTTEGVDVPAELTRIGKDMKPTEIMATMRDIIRRSYGKRDPMNPSKFDKSSVTVEEFMNSLAFDAFFTSLITSAEVAIQFVNGIFPKDLVTSEEMKQALVQAGLEPQNVMVPGSPDPKMSGLATPLDKEGKILSWAFREPTDKELTAMTKLQMFDVMKRQSSGWTPPE